MIDQLILDMKKKEFFSDFLTETLGKILNVMDYTKKNEKVAYFWKEWGKMTKK